MWIEKYRPKILDDIIGQDEIKERLKGFIRTKSLPHLLFAGPPGTGKTSAVLALAAEIFESENIRNNLLELNASDERGIDTIRQTVKDFAMTLPAGGAPFKIIVLDEADALTSQAQQALRRTMEKFVDTSRFVLLCNYPGKIIEPIQSRCAFFKFSPIDPALSRKRIIEITKIEKLKFDEKGMDLVLEKSNGDMRKALNILQACYAMGKGVTEDTVLETVGGLASGEIKDLIEKTAKDFSTGLKLLQDLIYVRGIVGSDLIREIYTFIQENKQIQNSKKILLMEHLAEADFRLAEGASPDIQLAFVLAVLTE